MNKIILISITALIISGCGLSKDKLQSPTLDSEEIQNTFIGKKFIWSRKNHNGEINYSKKGHARMTEINGEYKRGKWWVENDKLCRKWISERSNRSNCYTVSLIDGEYHLYISDDLIYRETPTKM